MLFRGFAPKIRKKISIFQSKIKLMKQEKLFGEFHAPTYDEWKKEAEALLKGAPFDKKMLTKTPEGIVLQPIYNKADGAAEPSLPGSGNYVRGISAGGYKAKPWAIS